MPLRFRLEDLSPAQQEQVRRQLSPRIKSDGRAERKSPTDAADVRTSPTPSPADAVSLADYSPKKVRRAPMRESSGSPNKTEADYNERVLGGKGRYEPVILRLPGGNYTPDWMTIDDGVVTFHETKGAWRFGSESRAILAFKSAAAAFPFFNFVWAQKQKGGKWIVKHAVHASDSLHDLPDPASQTSTTENQS